MYGIFFLCPAFQVDDTCYHMGTSIPALVAHIMVYAKRASKKLHMPEHYTMTSADWWHLVCGWILGIFCPFKGRGAHTANKCEHWRHNNLKWLQSEVTLGRGHNPRAIILDGTPPILDITPPCNPRGNGLAPTEENDAPFLEFWDSPTVLGRE